ncbi:4Fe-4S binding protein [Entomospira nematocerorum]|uniref:4Fe-4S binding protein n=1 Tax=Entomospira nematocerorum TaxID=2719987 RepID=A0A968GDV9_9SPIO|nr:4Fe-4S dicluster domain-containing protein [Entomospira nematocera]NIZ46393.1 4Fe-4S binding protein [Entomospira nematocera]WDI33803.1 4Fe-4S binding protein [Entomospira nematocera]
MIIPVLILSGIFLLLTAIFIFLFRGRYSEGVSKIRMIYDTLPQDDCRQCGYSSCEEFARALAMDEEPIVEKCRLMTQKEHQHTRNLLGYHAKNRVSILSEYVAYIACHESSGRLPKRLKVIAHAHKTCASVVELSGNDNECHESCVGLGDCIKWCPVDAIYRDTSGKVSINAERCIGCGICVGRCPKQVIHLVKRDTHVQVACSSDDTSELKAIRCSTGGCTACEMCQRVTNEHCFQVEGHLAKRLSGGLLRSSDVNRIVQACPTGVLTNIGQSNSDDLDQKLIKDIE